ncbi:MAG: hypothetical protein IRY99_05700 [Isosphaeraceae bacterium]|nr:hypothetical protein [Isosphaeraceae bacterium]
MLEHLIQLRRAWEGEFPEGGSLIRRRVDLPTQWPTGLDAPFRLTRAFQRPPIDPGRERLALRLGSVPGLRSIRLNEWEIARVAEGISGLTIDLPDLLPPRNRLVLDVDPSDWGEPPGLWGEVALVIRSD